MYLHIFMQLEPFPCIYKGLWTATLIFDKCYIGGFHKSTNLTFLELFVQN